MTQTVKSLLAVQETQVRSLGREDPLEKEMATHSSILAWRIPWTEEPGGLQSTGRQESDTTERLHSLIDLPIGSLFVLFDPLHPIVPLHSPPQVTTNLIFFL